MEGLVNIFYEQIINETDAAWHLLLDSSDPFAPSKEWFPKSRCEIKEDGGKASGVVWVPEWLAAEKGLI